MTPQTTEPEAINLRHEPPGTVVELTTKSAKYWITPVALEFRIGDDDVKAQVTSDSKWYWEQFGVLSPMMTSVGADLAPGKQFVIRNTKIGIIQSVSRKRI